MNLCSETVERGVPQGNRKGVEPEAYLNSTSQGPTPEDGRKEGHIRGRSSRIVKYSGWIQEENQSGEFTVILPDLALAT
jgi:hypothetical protein